MFDYRRNSIVTRRSQAKVDIADTIRRNITNIEDIEGYAENCLLVVGGAEHYGMTEANYTALVWECVAEVIKNNKE
jgi:hypothetical protein